MSGIQPIERFPVKPRKDGRFQKRIRGRLYYFGDNGDRDAALAEYDRVKRDLYSGRRPRATVDPPTMALKELANLFTDEKEAQANAGQITRQHFDDIQRAIKRFLKYAGGGRLVSDLASDDFADYSRHLGGKLGGHAYNRERALILSMFRHGAESGWCAVNIRQFARVGKGKLRLDRRNRMIDAKLIRKLIRAADTETKAMLLLGINGGCNAKDVTTIRWKDVDLKLGRIDTQRVKRNTVRQIPLWPETVAAIKRLPRTADDDPLFDVTPNIIQKRYAKLNPGHPLRVGFGALRHTFATIANEKQDRDASRILMGHVLPGMDDIYVERVSWQRLKRVTDHVRSKVFG